ncbi:MAG: aldehyde dehydrogenase family protein, partial [Phycisphaerales bacterium]
MTITQQSITDIAKATRAASSQVAVLDDATRAGVLRALAVRLDEQRQRVLDANAADIEAATENGIDAPKLKRLRLDSSGIDQLIDGLNQIADAPDPVGQITREQTLENGLNVQRQRTPLGVIAMIYEARPGVTVDAFALCFRSGNACILKGGREASRSNAALAELIRETLTAHGVTPDAMQSICDISRDEV